MTRLTDTFRNQLAAALFQNRYEYLFHIGIADKGKLHIIELHTADFLQLFFDPTPSLDCISQDFFHILFRVLFVRIDQLCQAGYHLSNTNGVSLIQASSQLKELVKSVRLRNLLHLTHELRKIIRNETIIIRKVFRTHLRDFPSRNITMHPVKKRTIDHRIRERLKQMGSLQKIVHTLVDISHKYHWSVRLNSVLPSCKRSRSHIVLHDLNAILVLEIDSGNLIKCHAIPKTYQTNLPSSHVIEEIGNRCLSAWNKNGVWRQLFINVRLTRSTRSQLTDIHIVFYQRNQPCQQMPFYSIVKLCRLHTAGTEKQIYPLFLHELASGLDNLILIQIRHLDRRDLIDHEWAAFLFILIIEIGQVNNTPDTTGQKLLIRPDILRMYINPFDAQEQKICLILISTLIQLNADLVDDRMCSLFLDPCLDLFCFIRTHIIIWKDPLHLFDTGFNFTFIVRCAIIPKQIFQHIGRNIRTVFDLLCCPLRNHTPRKDLKHFLI